MQPIKNIIFDFGGVIMDIDFTLTHKAFEKLGVTNFASLYNQHSAERFFVDFEKGLIPTEDFFNHIRRICHCELSNNDIRNAWNALLIGFPKERIDWLDRISRKYKIFLFSNTNIVHYQAFAKMFEEIFGRELNSFFVKAYYSHEMQLRKPDLASYRFILDEQQLNPAETLFIDDTIRNVEAAKELGIQTVHLQKPQTILDMGL